MGFQACFSPQNRIDGSKCSGYNEFIDEALPNRRLSSVMDYKISRTFWTRAAYFFVFKQRAMIETINTPIVSITISIS